jgi:hypothetical protein
LLEKAKRYKKYQWIEADISPNKGDPRPESYRVLNKDIQPLEKVGTDRGWEVRRKLILDNNKIYTNLKEVITLAHSNTLSLVIFKPTSILDFVVEDSEPEWPQEKVNTILNALKQRDLFEDQNFEDFKIMPKLPKKFSYRFKDDEGTESKLMIEDWEVGQLYWNCQNAYDQDQGIAKIREKYIDDFAKTKDLYLFLGTTREWHLRKAKNPFVIVGTFHPPFITQHSFI